MLAMVISISTVWIKCVICWKWGNYLVLRNCLSTYRNNGKSYILLSCMFVIIKYNDAKTSLLYYWYYHYRETEYCAKKTEIC